VTIRTSSLLRLCLALAAVPSVAGVLYDNGPKGPDADAWNVSQGFIVSDTFTLLASSTVNGFSFNAWLIPGDTQVSAEISISTQPNGGTSFFDQFVNFTQSNCTTNAYGYSVCAETASFNGPHLTAGTYWINLQNATVPDGDPVLWDENSGFGCGSPGCPSQAYYNTLGTIPSESFTIFGGGSTTTGTTPEAGTILLFGSGVLGLIGVFRRELL
jgi:hypothetical protein